jgi:hypothetical protein
MLFLLRAPPARQLCAIDLLPGMGEFLELADLPSIEFRSQLVGLMLADLFGTLVSVPQLRDCPVRAVRRAHASVACRVALQIYQRVVRWLFT